jgi:type VI secretion system secreted protein VgrG
MAENPTQARRHIAVDTHGALAADSLLLESFTGTEAVSQPFRFNLELLSAVDHAISFDKAVGRKWTVRITAPGTEIRYINGYVSRFAQVGRQGGFTRYRAELVPWLWFLTRHSNSKIFQNKKITDIIEEVLNEGRYGTYVEYQPRWNAGREVYQKREFCVQYQESDFNFVSRLMEECGIFYYFAHRDGEHTMVLGDDETAYGAHASSAGAIRRSVRQSGGVTESNVITDFEVNQELRPGKFTVNAYDFKSPRTKLKATAETATGVQPADKFELYEFTPDYTDEGTGSKFAYVRLEEHEFAHTSVFGAGTYRSFAAGKYFDLNDTLRFNLMCTCCGRDKRRYVIVQVEHSASVGTSYAGEGVSIPETYANRFTCVPHAVPMRPLRVTPKPVIWGPQTAVVVCEEGEEITTDEYGRIKVHFFWDRESQRNQDSSCWIRVSQPWASAQWGAITIPRKDQEVIVEFLEGDPDRPIVTGCVYNGDNKPPYSLPQHKTRTGIKSRSSKKGTTNHFNVIRFEDKKGEEEIRIHAERQLRTTVEGDEIHNVGHERKRETKKDDYTTIKEGNQLVTIEKGFYEMKVQEGNATLNVDKADRYVFVPMGVYQADAKQVLIKATQDITLECGPTKITMKVDGSLEINGVNIKITGGALIDEKAPMIKLNS